MRAASVRTIGALDVALWDLAGKVAGLPIHRLIGTYRDRVPAYASSQILDAASAYVEQAHEYRRPAGAPTRSTRRRPGARTSRSARRCGPVGEDFTLMLDACWGYYYEQALQVGRAIEAAGYYWFEDPLADSDIYGYVKLRPSSTSR